MTPEQIAERLPNILEWDHDDGIFLPMINDVARNQFWSDVIRDVVPGKKVVDIGSGTGFMAVLAIQHGAEHVYAVEQDFWRYQLVKHVVHELGLEDKITCINADVTKLAFPSDHVCIAELIGSKIFEESLLDVQRWAVDNELGVYPHKLNLFLNTHTNLPRDWDQRLGEKAFVPGIDINDKFTNVINQMLSTKYDTERQLDEQDMMGAKDLPPIMSTSQIPMLNFPESITADTEIPVRTPGDLFVSITWSLMHEEQSLDVRATNWSVPVKVLFNMEPGTATIRTKFDRRAKSWFISVVDKYNTT